MSCIEYLVAKHYTVHYVGILWFFIWFGGRFCFSAYVKHPHNTPEYNSNWAYFYSTLFVYLSITCLLSVICLNLLSDYFSDAFLTQICFALIAITLCGLLLWRAIVFGRRKHKHDHEVMKNYRETREKQSMDLWGRRYEVLSNHLAEVLPNFDLASLLQ